MHRVGCAPDDAVALARAIAARDELELAGVCTHLAVADEPDNPYTDRAAGALRRGARRARRRRSAPAARARGQLRRAARAPARATTSCASASRCYGLPRARRWPTIAGVALRRRCRCTARVTYVKRCRRAHACRTACGPRSGTSGRVATVPVGYADGVPRNLGQVGGEVLVGGRRRPIVGTVTMDQLLVDLGDVAVERRRRGRAHRPPGRRRDHRHRVGRAPRHHLLRDRHRHRRPRPAQVPSASRVATCDGTAGAEAHRARRGRDRGRGRPRLRDRARARRAPAPPRRPRRRACRSVPEFDEARILDSHDGGTIYIIRRGDGPPVVFCHGVTLSSRMWAKQFESFPAAGFRAVAFDHRGHGESTVGDTGHSLDNLADDLRTVLEGARPARRGARRPLDGRHGGAGVRHPPPRRRRRARARARAAVDVVAQPGERRHARPRARSSGSSTSGPTSARSCGSATSGSCSRGSASATTRTRATSRRPARCSRRATGDHARGGRRALLHLDLTEGLPKIARPDARGRRHRRRAHAAARRAPDRRAGARTRGWSSTRAPATCSCTSAPTSSTR